MVVLLKLAQQQQSVLHVLSLTETKTSSQSRSVPYEKAALALLLNDRVPLVLFAAAAASKITKNRASHLSLVVQNSAVDFS